MKGLYIGCGGVGSGCTAGHPSVKGFFDVHCFPMAGMVINLIVGVYIPIIRIPY